MESVMKYYPAIYQNRHHGTTTTTIHNNGDEIPIPDNSNNNNDNTLNETLQQQQHYQELGSTTSTTTRMSQNRTTTVIPTLFGQPLSRLSYRIYQSFVLFCIVMLIWSWIGQYYFYYIIGRHSNIRHQFESIDYMILLATFTQSFVLLGTCTYFINRMKPSELSLDAIIKYYASGFFLSASLALFWEIVSVTIINTFITLVLAIVGIDRLENPQSDHSWTRQPFGTNSIVQSSSSTFTKRLVTGNNIYDSVSVNRTDYATIFGLDHPVLYTIYIMIATFVVAGFIEEMCKYYGYRMVEHPDFFTRQELEEASAAILQQQHRRHNDHDDIDDDDNDDDFDDENDNSNAHCQPSIRNDSTFRPSVVNYSKQRQSVQGRGAAITLAMVSVAIGFACCENLIYIFHYAGESVMLELGVLLERSIFPIHPVLAAIQSIRICQRELEGTKSMKLGRIILPAVLFHGTFDFIIIFIGFIGKLVGQDEEEGDLRISNTTECLSIVSCVIIMSLSLIYLFNESSKQRARLAAIDLNISIDRSSLI
jgi:RsiW-degrading membrane proteinase PrsW (M82 family)